MRGLPRGGVERDAQVLPGARDTRPDRADGYSADLSGLGIGQADELVSALSAALVLTAGLDLVHGRAVPIDESAHLLEVVGTGLLWMLVHPRSRSQLAAV